VSGFQTPLLHVVECVNVFAILGLWLIAAGFLSLPVLYLRQRARAEAGRLVGEVADAALPDVLVQLPVFNEPHVVAGLLDSVAALDWPIGKLHIQLLDDSNDDTTAIAAAKIAELPSGLRIERVRREHRSGFKAAALAAGLMRSKAPFVAVLDADFRPPRNWLKAVVPQLIADPRAGFVQSRCEFATTENNWLTRAQGMLFDTHFVMEQGVRARAGLLFQFNGTCGVWRRAAIEDAGGWSSASLSEDLDLVVRAALAGWRGLYSAEPAVSGLMPHTIGDWRVQQKRWSMGFAQNARVWGGRIWRSDWSLSQRLAAEFLLLYQVAFPLITAAIIASIIDLAAGCPDLPVVGPLWALTALIVLILAVGMTLPAYSELRRGGPGRYITALAGVPALVVVLAFSSARMVLSGFVGREDIFHRTPKVASPAPEAAEPAIGDRL
jgi:cellulose synthase/poly-beta-1,6-N-acetylglucosamine synthase-like glycosyltransferase